MRRGVQISAWRRVRISVANDISFIACISSDALLYMHTYILNLRVISLPLSPPLSLSLLPHLSSQRFSRTRPEHTCMGLSEHFSHFLATHQFVLLACQFFFPNRDVNFQSLLGGLSVAEKKGLIQEAVRHPQNDPNPSRPPNPTRSTVVRLDAGSLRKRSWLRQMRDLLWQASLFSSGRLHATTQTWIAVTVASLASRALQRQSIFFAKVLALSLQFLCEGASNTLSDCHSEANQIGHMSRGLDVCVYSASNTAICSRHNKALPQRLGVQTRWVGMSSLPMEPCQNPKSPLLIESIDECEMCLHPNPLAWRQGNPIAKHVHVKRSISGPSITSHLYASGYLFSSRWSRWSSQCQVPAQPLRCRHF